MLFDLRSRGRRTAVRGVYLFLAILIGGGLILFGVGTGVGGGGLLDAFNGGGSGNQGQVISSAEKTALKAVKARPNDPSAWASLIQARWTAAGQSGNYNSATGTFTTAGHKEAVAATQAWQQYLQLTHGKDPNAMAILAARAYGALAEYGQEASAYEIFAASNPSAVKGYECLAASAYAAKQTRKGDLALAKATSMVPKVQRKLLAQQIQAAKKQPIIAAQC